MERRSQKEAGAYYTPDSVVASLIQWVVQQAQDRMLDPSCGDGRFIAGHRYSVGIEQNGEAVRQAITRAPWARVYEDDFFTWASTTHERFECVAGNPPFIRYQSFKGEMRDRALRLCSRLGASFTGLTSSWAPFLVVASSLLLPGGRMAFVVPAEIGHAPYAAPLLEYLIAQFAVVHVVAVRNKFFPELSEDCWLLYAEGFGAHTAEIFFSVLDAFGPMSAPPQLGIKVSVREWREAWNRRLRPFIMPAAALELYREAVLHPQTRRFGEVASIGIGYVTGANDFFHLRPSEAVLWGIPEVFLHPTVRNGRALPPRRLTVTTVKMWCQNDNPVLLLRLPKHADLPTPVRKYLDTEAGQRAREAYKCRMREPWYAVPDVQVPDFFLTYMSGLEPNLVRNEAGCTCTNSVHSVRVRDCSAAAHLVTAWESPFLKLSCEIEGHPLGGGMLKLEPGEANQLVIPSPGVLSRLNDTIIEEAITTMRTWRHYAAERPLSTTSRVCQWVNLRQALYHFATYTGPTQSQQHIKPLHWYVACRLVLEGGFHPDNITPRPPFAVVTRRGENALQFAPNLATGSERTILGGLKTKDVDVVVTKEGIGPVMAVSCKGMTGAFRNLTNRMEETIGECTNLHITYPAMVFGYLFVIRANRAAEIVAELGTEERVPARVLAANDIAMQRGGEPVEAILRFHAALRELTGRRGIRNDGSRYEAVALALIETTGAETGEVLTGFPPHDSPLRLEQFFQTLYLRYEERYLYGAPELKTITQRLAWSPTSLVFGHAESETGAFPALDYDPRLAVREG